MLPLTTVPFWAPIFDPQPIVSQNEKARNHCEDTGRVGGKPECRSKTTPPNRRQKDKQSGSGRWFCAKEHRDDAAWPIAGKPPAALPAMRQGAPPAQSRGSSAQVGCAACTRQVEGFKLECFKCLEPPEREEITGCTEFLWRVGSERVS